MKLLLTLLLLLPLLTTIHAQAITGKRALDEGEGEVQNEGETLQVRREIDTGIRGDCQLPACHASIRIASPWPRMNQDGQLWGPGKTVRFRRESDAGELNFDDFLGPRRG
ncbi:uncharacterized protein LOC143824605 [Paroedura picta]|uniref:uncharacterized protein LOC143824605 n=1 Tax=Paroedura picta TaxID=143630 RepID=UPI004055FA8B